MARSKSKQKKAQKKARRRKALLQRREAEANGQGTSQSTADDQRPPTPPPEEDLKLMGFIANHKALIEMETKYFNDVLYQRPIEIEDDNVSDIVEEDEAEEQKVNNNKNNDDNNNNNNNNDNSEKYILKKLKKIDPSPRCCLFLFDETGEPFPDCIRQFQNMDPRCFNGNPAMNAFVRKLKAVGLVMPGIKQIYKRYYIDANLILSGEKLLALPVREEATVYQIVLSFFRYQTRDLSTKEIKIWYRFCMNLLVQFDILIDEFCVIYYPPEAEQFEHLKKHHQYYSNNLYSDKMMDYLKAYKEMNLAADLNAEQDVGGVLGGNAKLKELLVAANTFPAPLNDPNYQAPYQFIEDIDEDLDNWCNPSKFCGVHHLMRMLIHTGNIVFEMESEERVNSYLYATAELLRWLPSQGHYFLEADGSPMYIEDKKWREVAKQRGQVMEAKRIWLHEVAIEMMKKEEEEEAANAEGGDGPEVEENTSEEKHEKVEAAQEGGHGAEVEENTSGDQHEEVEAANEDGDDGNQVEQNTSGDQPEKVEAAQEGGAGAEVEENTSEEQHVEE